MSKFILTAALTLLTAAPVLAEGDAAKGEADFKKCKSCHTIADGDEVYYKGGKTGPNLYGVVGRAAGSTDFKYGDSIAAAGAAGLVWTEEELVKYVMDPKAYLQDYLDDKAAKSKMTFKLKTPEDVIAYLATFSDDDEAEGKGDSN